MSGDILDFHNWGVQGTQCVLLAPSGWKQGCCSTLYNAQDGPHITPLSAKNGPAQMSTVLRPWETQREAESRLDYRLKH